MTAAHTPGRVLIEVAVDSAHDALAAANAGADRIELCARLDLDGLTPQPALIRSVKRSAAVPVLAMIRPTEGDFICDEAGLALMLRQIDESAAAGADGCVFGLLHPDRTIDQDKTRRLVERCGPLPSVFHRAFDRVSDPGRALETLVMLGVTRILTSGGAPSAASEAGIAGLAALTAQASRQIEILPGGGVRSGNAREILARTRCSQLHSSCRAPGADRLSVDLLRELRTACDASG